MALDHDDALYDALRAAGWRFDPLTGGWKKGSDWVSHKQAREAHAAARDGAAFHAGEGESRAINEITAQAANLDVANDP